VVLMAWNPSSDLFQNRLGHLVIRDSLEGVAGTYGVRPQTVKNWLRGGSQPSARTKRSVASRGQRITGPTRVVRNPNTNRFETPIIDGRAVKAISTINRRRNARSILGQAAATNERQRMLAELEGEPLTIAEERDLDRRLRSLTEREALGEESNELKRDWNSFRQDYEALATTQDPLDRSLEEDEEVVSRPRRARRRAPIQGPYTIISGKPRSIQTGSRGGLFYLEPSGRKVYVQEGRVLGY